MMTSEINWGEMEVQGLLDRLVCDELDEPSRARLLSWLDEDATRWRACGLAFLEAQTWSAALERSPSAAPGGSQASCSRPPTPGAVNGSRQAISTGLTAAAVCLAFFLGLAFRSGEPSLNRESETAALNSRAPESNDPSLTLGKIALPPEDEPILAALDVQAGGRSGPATAIRIPVVPAALDASQPARQPGVIPDYVKQQWQRRGYNVSLERRYLFARLPDGQSVVVPVEKLNVNRIPLVVN
ncbi:MAG TPA: hypothetical protein VKU82_13830 [Planctomycetaceae bacterium]|nr:hypothetical protein [Planctomycetaceae bacterium]